MLRGLAAMVSSCSQALPRQARTHSVPGA